MDANAIDNAIRSIDLQDLLVNHPFLVALYFILLLFGIFFFITACRVLRYFSHMIQESAYFKRIEMTQRRRIQGQTWNLEYSFPTVPLTLPLTALGDRFSIRQSPRST